ncbi:Low-density lipoprotein receptor domain class A [Popillia japonica]|uniref:Low-density lipoprotein receptor domain class A n=1 Tax=Popillia japonica TaxID=7064 RepID=A0AAW1MGC8_POPJA
MIPRSTVQLTKVHFYDPARCDRNLEIATISRDIFRCELAKNPIIKRNIFGHKWVLKINENQDGEKHKCTAKIIVYIWVFCCIIVAIAFGIYFTIESKYFPAKNHDNTTPTVLPDEKFANDLNNVIHQNLTSKFDVTTSLQTTPALPSPPLICTDCIKNEEICMKMEEFHAPICVKLRDRRDPTGCGGLCELNTQHCKRLHSKIEVFQCVKNKNILRCPGDDFSCGNMCIPRTQRCDGVVHCSNMGDEMNCECDLKNYFHCGNGTSCIENAKKCNGVIDCWDKTDEFDCHRDCEVDEKPCSSGECIKKEYFCDGIPHCSDNSDEPQGC